MPIPNVLFINNIWINFNLFKLILKYCFFFKFLIFVKIMFCALKQNKIFFTPMNYLSYKKLNKKLIDEERAIAFLIDIGRLHNRPCNDTSCNGQQLSIKKDKQRLGGFKLFCGLCKRSTTVIKYLNPRLPKMTLENLIHVAYLYSFRLRNWQIAAFTEVSKRSFIKI